jgi:homocitrate synthase NifV
VNGLGERAGNAPLEEVIFALKYSSGIDLGFDGKLLADLSAYVEKISGRKQPVSKPVTGELAFSHESGIHCRSLKENPLSYQPFQAQVRFRTSLKTGRSFSQKAKQRTWWRESNICQLK